MERNLTNEEIIKNVEEYVNSTFIPALIQEDYKEFRRMGFHRLYYTKLYKSVIVLYYDEIYYVNCRFCGSDNKIYWETFAVDKNGKVYEIVVNEYLIHVYLFSKEVNLVRYDIACIEDEDKKNKVMDEFEKRYNRLNKIYENSKHYTTRPGFESIHFNINEYMTSEVRNYMNSL